MSQLTLYRSFKPCKSCLLSRSDDTTDSVKALKESGH